MYTPKNSTQLMDILGDLHIYAEVNGLHDVAEHLSDAMMAARGHSEHREADRAVCDVAEGTETDGQSVPR